MPITNSVELGVKFRSDVAGRITGIRFYKADTNTGVLGLGCWGPAARPITHHPSPKTPSPMHSTFSQPPFRYRHNSRGVV